MKLAALDIGGSSIKYANMDENQNIYARGKKKTPLDNMEHLWSVLDEIWAEIGQDCEGLAVSMPGVIDSERGYAFNGGSLAYLKEMGFAQQLQQRYHVPAWIGNDAKCAGIAEVGYGALKDVKDAIVIILGTGIGGCLIKDRQVHYGSHFSAGEVSFVHTDMDDWETDSHLWCNVNGSVGLRNSVKKHLKTDVDYTGEEIFQMVENGNQQVLDALDEFCRRLAIQLFNMQCVFDAQKIVIGGGISAQPLLLEMLQEKYLAVSGAFPYPVFVPEIAACQFNNDANLLGAAYQWQQMMKMEKEDM